ncbi:MAG: hypothetical protein V4454_00620 [Pseudomonadota bacterium]
MSATLHRYASAVLPLVSNCANAALARLSDLPLYVNGQTQAPNRRKKKACHR